MTELIVALDRDSVSSALDVVGKLGDSVEWYKVGSQLFCCGGPDAVRELKSRGKKVFLDLKYHDIPNTVAQAVSNAVRMGADMVNVHAQGGDEMMSRAVEAAHAVQCGGGRPMVIAVTVLTSMDDNGLRRVMDVDDGRTAADQVRHLAGMAASSGMDGVVCSAYEIELIREVCGKSFKLIVPGIRPAGGELGDQKRVMTPSEAAAAGADYIVVGRPVIDSIDPAATVRQIVSDLLSA